MDKSLSQCEIDELIEMYRRGKLENFTEMREILYRKGAEQLSNVLSQREIDELLESIYVSQSKTLTTLDEVLQRSMEKFKHNQVYTVEDYDLFYCKYALEDLTSCASMLRRYAYCDTESFRKFKYFIVLEEYKSKEINAVLVTGVPSEEFSDISEIYRGCQEKGITYLVDASSLNYAFTISDNDGQDKS